MNPLTVEEVRALLLRAVEEKGADYVYPQDLKGRVGHCLYFHEGQPSCIVGHVYAYAGVTDAKEGETPRTDNVLDVSDYVAKALEEAQSEQDEGKTWGQALEAFDKAVAEA